MKAKRVYQLLNEFERGIDPKRALGISRRAKIEEWFEEYAPDAQYEIGKYFSIVVIGNLDLEGSSVKRFPNVNSIKVYGSLFLNNSEIKELPGNLYVEEDLHLNNTRISELPDDLVVGNYIDFRNSDLTSQDIKDVNCEEYDI